MKKTTKTLGEMRQFCLTEGYLFAVYVRQANEDYHLNSGEANYDEDTFPDDMKIVCDVEGCGVSYREVKSEDGLFIFRIHNNYNLPKIIPTIKKEK